MKKSIDNLSDLHQKLIQQPQSLTLFLYWWFLRSLIEIIEESKLWTWTYNILWFFSSFLFFIPLTILIWYFISRDLATAYFIWVFVWNFSSLKMHWKMHWKKRSSTTIIHKYSKLWLCTSLIPVYLVMWIISWYFYGMYNIWIIVLFLSATIHTALHSLRLYETAKILVSECKKDILIFEYIIRNNLWMIDLWTGANY